ncbi:MAG: amphi-Trp domain-containing protein [Haloarculaceae archaeon]
MPEKVLFETEQHQSRSEIAAYLRTVADKLESGESLTLQAGEQSVTLNVPATPTFEVKAEREGPTGSPGELSVEFELEWDEGTSEEGGDAGLEIT